MKKRVDGDPAPGTPKKLTTNNNRTSNNKNVSMDTLKPAIEGINLQLVEQDKIFTAYGHNGKFQPDISNTPIFEINGNVYYVIPLKPIEITDNDASSDKSPKSVIGVYGSKAGYGLEPLSFYTESGDAEQIINITDANPLINTNQSRTIELGIKRVLNNGDIVKKSPILLLNNFGNYSSEDVVDEIINNIKYYIKLDDDSQYLIAACFIIGTYLFPLFSTFGYLIISGEKGTGKGTFLDLMGKMCWNATNKLISISEAVLFRRIDEQLPTFIIDEYHRAIINRSSGNALISILESGYEKGGCVPRTVPYTDGNIKDFKIVDFHVYCPKILATRKPVEADDKSIKIIMPKLIDDKKYAKRKIELFNDPFFDKIRLKIMEWCIGHQNQVLEEYGAIEPTSQLNGREFNVWLPVLAIAKVAFPEKYEDLVNFAGKTISQARSSKYEKEDRVLTALHSLSKSGKLRDGGERLNTPSYKVTNKDINDTLQEIENEGMHHNSIKSALDNLKIVGKTETGTYWINKGKLKDKLEERGFLDESKSKGYIFHEKYGYFRVNQTQVSPEYKNLTSTETAILSVLAGFSNHTISSLMDELNESEEYQEDDIINALTDMKVRGEIEISGGEWFK